MFLIFFHFKNKLFKIIDTAGINKKSNVVSKSINSLSIKKSISNIIEVDTAFIIIDSSEGLDRQDKRIIKMVSDKAKSLIIIFNKIDLIDDKIKFKDDTVREIEGTVTETRNLKIFFITAFSKSHINKLLNYLHDTNNVISKKISTSKLNQWLKITTKNIHHPLVDRNAVSFKYAVQIKDRPVTIKIFCNHSSKIKANYKKYLINNFNKNFNIINQKTKFVFSSSKNPYI